MDQTDEETPEEFTRRVHVTMATALGVQCTSFTSADKVEYAKRKLIDAEPCKSAKQNDHSLQK